MLGQEKREEHSITIKLDDSAFYVDRCKLKVMFISDSSINLGRVLDLSYRHLIHVYRSDRILLQS